MASNTTIALERRGFGHLRVSAGICYVAVSTSLFCLWVGFYLFNPFGFDSPARDTWHHVAVLRELMAAPFAPSNPHIPTNEPSRYYTPVALVAALIGKLLGSSPYRLLGYVGAATCVGFVVGCWSFGRRYYASAWAPLILLLTLLFGWGAQLGHAGLHNYATFLSSAGYPSTIVIVLGLFSWSLALQVVEGGTPQTTSLVGLAALSAVILLEHQLSGVIVLAGTGSLILFHDRADVRSKGMGLAAILLGCICTLAWPYYPILDVVFSASDPRWKSVVEEMNQFSVALVLAAPTLAGIFGFRKAGGGLRWELLVPAAFFTIAYIVLKLSDSTVAHRIPAAIILYNQLGLVWVVLAYAQNSNHSRNTKLTIAAVAVLFIAWAAVTSAKARLQDLRWRSPELSLIYLAQSLQSYLPPDSVSFATENVVFPLQSTGRRVVSIPRPEPAAPSLRLRQIATDRFFSDATTNEERQRLIDRWGATDAVFFPSDLKPTVIEQLRALGPSKKFSHNVEVITLHRSSVGELTNLNRPAESGGHGY